MQDKLEDIQAQARDERHETELLDDYLSKARNREASFDKVELLVERQRFLTRKLNDKEKEAWSWNIEAFFKLRQGRTDGTFDALNHAIDIFLQLGHVKGLMSSYLCLGGYFLLQADFKAAIEAFLSTAHYADIGGNQEMKRGAYTNIGLAYFNMSDYTRALKYFNHSLSLANIEKPDRSIALLYNNIGSVHTQQGNYAEALKAYFAAKDIYEGINDKGGLSRIYAGLGEVNKMQGNLAAAANCYRMALQYGGSQALGLDMVYVSLNLAKLYIQMGHYAQAELITGRALETFEREGDQKGIARCYSEMGDMAFGQQQWQKASEYHRTALEVNRKIGHKDGIVNNLIGLAAVHSRCNDHHGAVMALTEAVELAVEIRANPLHRDCELALSEAYSAMGEHPKALHHYREYHRISTVILGEETRKQLNQLSFQHDLEQMEKHLELEKTARRAEEEKNALLSKQKALTEKSLREREVLLKEIHHRVKNNLQIISGLLELQGEDIEDIQARAAISEGQNRVRSIALIHNKLYQNEDLTTIEFKNFVEELYAQAVDVFLKNGQVVEAVYSIEETWLDIDTMVPLGLILNELITNAFKYAFDKGSKGILSFALEHLMEGRYRLTVRDNGAGLAAGMDPGSMPSLGMKLIHNLSAQIGGSTGYHYDGGSVFTVLFSDTSRRI